MAENTIFIKKYSADDKRFEINSKEVWRYAGYSGIAASVDSELQNVYDQMIKELEGKFAYKVCYRRMEIEWSDDMPLLPFPSQSKNLAKCLKGSNEIVIFAATIGLEIDRYIAKYQRFSATKALLIQAYGAERVECLCDVFCSEIRDEAAKQGLSCSARFSPGYGDLLLEKQKDFFRLLDCNRQIGISLNESLLMTPSKSVTAIFGLGSCLGEKTGHKCSNCTKTDCEYKNK